MSRTKGCRSFSWNRNPLLDVVMRVRMMMMEGPSKYPARQSLYQIPVKEVKNTFDICEKIWSERKGRLLSNPVNMTNNSKQTAQQTKFSLLIRN